MNRRARDGITDTPRSATMEDNVERNLLTWITNLTWITSSVIRLRTVLRSRDAVARTVSTSSAIDLTTATLLVKEARRLTAPPRTAASRST
jgi:hypothetical protein